MSTLLEERSASLDLGPDVVACKVNTGEAGFYRVQYANPEDLLGLGPRIRDRQLGPEDRWGLQEDLFALVQTGAAHLDDYLDLLSFYEEENAYLPLVGIAGNLFHAWLVLEGDRREAVARTTRTILERALARTGYQPLPGETHETSALRDSILFQAASCGFGEAAQFLVETFGFMQKGGLVHPDIVRAAMQAGAAFAEGNTLEWFRKRLRTTESEHDRINVLTALGCFQDKGQIQSALAFLLDEVPDRNKFIPLVRAAANPMASPLLWDWFEDHLERLEKLHPIHFERIIGALVPLAGLDREDRVRTFFGEFMSRKETARDVILMALEKLEINRRMRAS